MCAGNSLGLHGDRRQPVRAKAPVLLRIAGRQPLGNPEWAEDGDVRR